MGKRKLPEAETKPNKKSRYGNVRNLVNRVTATAKTINQYSSEEDVNNFFKRSMDDYYKSVKLEIIPKVQDRLRTSTATFFPKNITEDERNEVLSKCSPETLEFLRSHSEIEKIEVKIYDLTTPINMTVVQGSFYTPKMIRPIMHGEIQSTFESPSAFVAAFDDLLNISLHFDYTLDPEFTSTNLSVWLMKSLYEVSRSTIISWRDYTPKELIDDRKQLEKLLDIADKKLLANHEKTQLLKIFINIKVSNIPVYF